MMKSDLMIAEEVIAGKWSYGDERKKKLIEAGYDYNTIQAMVNQMAKTGKKIKEITIDAEDVCGLIINLKV